MKSISVISAIVLLIQILHIPCQAQGIPKPKFGDWVRITAPSISSKEMKGKLLENLSDSLVVRKFTSGRWENVAFPLDSITKLEIRVSKTSNIVKYMAIGFLLGTASGLYYVKGAETGDGYIFAFAGVVGAFGAGVGLTIGLFSRREVWQTVPLDRLHSKLSGPQMGGLRISLSHTF